MASGGPTPTAEQCKVCRDTLRKYVKVADPSIREKDPETINTMNSKACGKMAKDVFGQKMVNPIDSSVFPKCQDKKTKQMDLSDEKMKEFLSGVTMQMLSLEKPNKKGDEACQKEYLNKCVEKLAKANPDVKQVKTSKTGGVDKMTDTSKYTGSHKERFDESGKGKGAEGRVEKVDDSGYVGNYKGEGTYDKK